MNPFKTVTSVVTPLDKVNVDTDQIIPKQFLKRITKSGFGEFLFFDWKYERHNVPNRDFVLNDPRYASSEILITGDNFGCGSSREHAVWSLADYGFSVIIAPSFANIFYSNCFKNGLLPITLDSDTVQQLMQEIGAISVNLERQLIITSDKKEIPFQIESEKKSILLRGLDDITQTLQYSDKISEFEETSSKIPSLA